jgi:AraC-like DNA-binding protein
VVHHFGLQGSTNLSVTSANGPKSHVLVLNLTGGINFEGRFGGRHAQGPVQHGRINLLCAGVDFELEMSGNFIGLVLGIPETDLAPALAETGVVLDPILIGAALPGVASLLGALELDIKTPGQGSHMLYDATLMALAGGLAGRAPDHQERIAITQVKLRRVTEFVMANLDRDIGLADLAAVASLSPFHFARVFRMATGISPYRFLMQRRMGLACELLADPSLPIVEIAHRCGYAGQAHFTTAFQKYNGLPPGRYRRQLGG